ncbi:MAG: hypothetical protein CM1200mP35_04480 [Chloroflexota bacterium]|nr:MAG: hypothetical protein CM1200mP35_04480 [Chloroflexota bacterium]
MKKPLNSYHPFSKANLIENSPWPEAYEVKLYSLFRSTPNLSHTVSLIASDRVYPNNHVLNQPPTRQLSNRVLKQGVS